MFVKRLLQRHLSHGLVDALRQLRTEIAILVVHRRSTRKSRKLLGTAPVKLNCGCGPAVKRDWINVDLHKRADLRLDLREKLPFPDSSVSFIYSEHFFEHLEHPQETGRFLGESLRVLIPGGQFRVGVPDTEWPLCDYARGIDDHFRFVRAGPYLPAYCDTKMHSINYHFRQGSEHKWAYDYETLAKVLSQAGFSLVEKSEFDPALDSEHRRIGTLYVNAFKDAPIRHGNSGSVSVQIQSRGSQGAKRKPVHAG